MTVYNEFERTWKKEVAAYLKVLFRYLPGWTDENRGNTKLTEIIPQRRSELGTSWIQSVMEEALAVREKSQDAYSEPECASANSSAEKEDVPSSAVEVKSEVEDEGDHPTAVTWRHPLDLAAVKVEVNDGHGRLCQEGKSPKNDAMMHSKCHVCGKLFKRKHDLKRHLLTHTGLRPYVCDICGKGFSQSSNLKTHIQLHTGEKPYMCNVCFKSFVRKSHLQGHSQAHTVQKPYVCSECGKGFSQNCTLKGHILTHTGEKSHICSVCGKGFTRADNLRTHIITHSAEKPHVCNICNKKFKYSRTLNIHVRTHNF